MDVTFYQGTDGSWLRREWSRQCPFKELLYIHRCQGVEGHEGEHWCYRPDGSYVSMGGVSTGLSLTPPGHPKWISPVDKAYLHYMSVYVDSEVTEPEEIARLNRGEHSDNESLDRPVTDPRILKMLEEMEKEARWLAGFF